MEGWRGGGEGKVSKHSVVILAIKYFSLYNVLFIVTSDEHISSSTLFHVIGNMENKTVIE